MTRIQHTDHPLIFRGSSIVTTFRSRSLVLTGPRCRMKRRKGGNALDREEEDDVWSVMAPVAWILGVGDTGADSPASEFLDLALPLLYIPAGTATPLSVGS